MIKEVIEGRIFGGMHYRTSGRHGAIIGRKVAHWLAKHYFQPVGSPRGKGGREGRRLWETMVVEGDSNADGGGGSLGCGSDAGLPLRAQAGTPACLRASDANDDGAIDISDAVYTLSFLFLGGPAPRPTLPEPTEDDPFADRLELRGGGAEAGALNRCRTVAESQGPPPSGVRCRRRLPLADEGNTVSSRRCVLSRIDCLRNRRKVWRSSLRSRAYSTFGEGLW